MPHPSVTEATAPPEPDPASDLSDAPHPDAAADLSDASHPDPAPDLSDASHPDAAADAIDTPRPDAAAPRADAPATEDSAAAAEDAGPTFADLGLPEHLLAAVRRLGFAHPSPIQAKAIGPLLAGRDITGVAQTGTGKTAAFGLPLLAKVEESSRATQALVLTPTRELAMQVASAIDSFSATMPGVQVLAVYGGAPYVPQEKALEKGVQVVVGTPGRVIDHLSRGNLRLGGLRYLVLDEADEMLRMGFAEDVDRILEFTPENRQVALFSATMPAAIQRVANEHLHDPVTVAVSRQAMTVPAVEQSYAVVPFRHKIGALTRVLQTSDSDAAIVFCRTRGAAEDVGVALISRGISAATISGDVAQKEREKIVERLRDGTLDVLVATDVAARGLDVERIGLVVNFDVPQEPEIYVHRIGRTGRAGRSGRAVTFFTPHERGRLRAIERTTRQQLTEIQVPSPADVSRHRITRLLAGAEERAAAGRLGMYGEVIDEYLSTHEMTPSTLLAVLAATAVGDAGPSPRDEEEFTGAALSGRDRDSGNDGAGSQRDRTDRREHDRPGRGPRAVPKGVTRYKLGVGHNHGATPQAIVGAITGEAGLRGKDIGKIDIFPSFALVDISGELTDMVLEKIGKARIGGRALRMRKDTGPKADRGSDRPARKFAKRPRS